MRAWVALRPWGEFSSLDYGGVSSWASLMRVSVLHTSLSVFRRTQGEKLRLQPLPLHQCFQAGRAPMSGLPCQPLGSAEPHRRLLTRSQSWLGRALDPVQPSGRHPGAGLLPALLVGVC